MYMKIEKRYFDGTYLKHNPSWDSEDAAWKAALVTKVLTAHNIQPRSICELGCGTGDVLRTLHPSFPMAMLTGYDVSPQLTKFWNNHGDAKIGINFILGNLIFFKNELMDINYIYTNIKLIDLYKMKK